LQQADIPLNLDWIQHGDFEMESGYTAMRQLLALPDRPTAVFAASDSMAAGVYKAVQEQNLSIPQDIAVMGFDDNPSYTHNPPPLTTIRQPIHQLGESAAKLLLDLINDRPTPDHLILEPHLIVRKST